MKKNKGKKVKTTDLYEKFKYKTKGKPRAAFGTQLEENRQPGEDPSGNQIDKVGVQAAGAVNPLFGALAETGIASSKAVRGNALNQNRNTAAEAIDPFGWAKGNQNAGDWAKSIFLGPASWSDKGARRKQAALQNNAAQNAAINPSLISNAKLKKGGYVLGGDPPVDGNKPFGPFQLESWKKQGVLDSLGRGTMLKGSYQDFNKYFGNAIPVGADPTEQTFHTSPVSGATSLEQLLIKKQKPTQFHTVMGDTVPHDKMGLKKGGNALASKLNVLDGGNLHSISPTAVEVKADQPHKEDSVELENAFVDDGEVIDNKNRVFSEELGYAKQAKKLEKQKSKNPRFSAANEHIDRKLDALFQHQEENKDIMARKPKEREKSTMAAGGTYRPKSYKRKPNDSVEIGPRATSKHLEPKVRLSEEEDVRNKMSFLEGGYVPPQDRVMITSQQRLRRKGFADGGDMQSQLHEDFMNRAKGLGTFTAKTPESSLPTFTPDRSSFKAPKINARETAANLATFVPNVVSAFAQRNLKGPVSPILEQSRQLDRVRPDAQLAEIEREGGATNQLIKNNTAQAGDLASAYGNTLAKKIAAKNQVYGQNQALNAEIQGREANLNVPIGARNTERLNQFRQGQADFSNLQQKLTTENVSNLAGKVLGRVREANQMDLDKFKFNYAQKQFEDSGVGKRAYEDSNAQMKSYYDKFMPKEDMKKGGKIHIKPENKGKFNALKKKTGKTTEQLKHSKNPLTRKRATFAANAKKWHHK